MTAVFRLLAELLVTLGLVVVAFAVYVVLWSDVRNAAAQADLRDTFEAQVRQASRVSVAGGTTPAAPTAAPVAGSALGVLEIPRLGDDWSWVMVEGVGDDDIARGPGHFPGTALPGQLGNFAVAGHRATHGEPFAHLDEVRPGDEVVVRTVSDTFTYVVDSNEIVTPSALEVIAPVPGRPGATPREAMLTLVTCHPRWGSSERMIVTARLVNRTLGGS